jgi:hypothetical protein
MGKLDDLARRVQAIGGKSPQVDPELEIMYQLSDEEKSLAASGVRKILDHFGEAANDLPSNSVIDYVNGSPEFDPDERVVLQRIHTLWEQINGRVNST